MCQSSLVLISATAASGLPLSETLWIIPLPLSPTACVVVFFFHKMLHSTKVSTVVYCFTQSALASLSKSIQYGKTEAKIKGGKYLICFQPASEINARSESEASRTTPIDFKPKTNLIQVSIAEADGSSVSVQMPSKHQTAALLVAEH